MIAFLSHASQSRRLAGEASSSRTRRRRIALDVQAGDRILFGKYSGSEVKIEDDEYVIMREEDVFAILD